MAKQMKAPPGETSTTATTSTLSKVFLREWVLVGMLIFGGCCSNVYTLELLVTHAPKSGHLITLAQFLVVAVEGFLSNLEWGWGPALGHASGPKSFLPLRLKERKIPIRYWIGMVVLFWTVSVLNNASLGYNIAMPLHIIFRSGSLFVSMVFSWLFFGKIFSRQQILGVLLVSVGVVISTYNSAGTGESTSQPFRQWLTGIGLLTLALVLACLLGQLQQLTYTKFGRHWREGLFYTHFLGMPAFLLFYDDIRTQIIEYNSSPLVSLIEAVEPFLVTWLPSSVWTALNRGPWLQVRLPSMWLYLLLNTATQYVCISGVHRLSSMASSVTLNMILSVRKFVSLLLSILLFNNHFSIGHWFGAAAVFIGTAIYSGIGGSPNTTTVKVKSK
ncbi:UDP-galactose transporter [Spizellomyces punctatus DAOM BR117]|uniref:UDP-galactose transporter n=1 Tax=Spizellomyces punctatus (strain DAOM BR117) TaxID=645134 RepID=A0A0L0HAT5_SPIPD|nr:UDP-galactose transporter [Spizellomyces punctatus DAOM BR117]KNC98675.1 UDP-galactose transporter [Spizellomyces punctatus DAOM BR117]|eukprot:XP_016606715.1 UDP-galactose transporter [Spizellomyces punctatus DAOM BR117]